MEAVDVEEQDNMQIKKSTFWMFGFLIAIAIVAYFFFFRGSSTVSANNSVSQGDVQKIVLSYKNHNYYPNTIRVKAGQPVSVTLDSSVAGCFRSFNIKELGVSEYSQSPSQTIDFTPTQKGTYRFACSMGMGYGTIIVE